jgi:aquaporin Z
MKKLAAEFIGTFWLVFAGIGSALVSAAVPDVGIGLLGVSLAFGLTVMTMAYTVGGISGGHFNPAVTVGLATAGRTPWASVPGYVIAQVIGGTVGAFLLYFILSGKAGFSVGSFASNGYGEHSMGGYSMMSCFLTEAVFTAMFLVVILGVTGKSAPAGFAPIAIGLCLTLIHLAAIPISNSSVNPARSTATALVAGGWALQELWLFWVAPIIGGIVGAVIHKSFFADE